MRLIHDVYGALEDAWHQTSTKVFDQITSGTAAFFALLQERQFRTFRSRVRNIFHFGDVVEVKNLKKPFFSGNQNGTLFGVSYEEFSVNNLDMVNVKDGDILILTDTRVPNDSGFPFIFYFVHNGQTVVYLYYVDVFEGLNPIPWKVICRVNT